ncbi:hypothetical protein HN789_02950 [archaeon]|jgi:hypothetical protein|nr:hypothetical protein [archaeon]MBT6772455.1 hypothetical protein [archaeon]MBT7440173.1 hypothetical protein [archaeon]
MKKIAMIMVVFLLTLASALAVDPVASSVLLGGEDQERGQTVSTIVYVTNYNTLDVKHIDVTSFTGNAKYVVTDISEDVTETAENVTSVSISAYVPLDFDAVDAKGKKTSFSIGAATLTVTYTDDTTDDISVPLSMEAENLLEFHSDSRITIGDEGDSKFRNDKSYDDVNRDDKIVLDITLENKFDNNGDCDDPDDYGDCEIQDIEVELEADDSDFDDENVDFNDMNSESEDVESLSFDVPDDVKEDDYDFDIYVTGDDENGARHGEFWTFTLEVEVPDDEITITDAYVNPSRIDCDVKHVTLKVEIENSGTDDQRKAAIEIDSPRLDLQDSIYNIDIDEGDSDTKTFDISLPDDVDPGTYFITVSSFYDNNKESDVDSVQLIVEECYEEPVVDDDIDWEEEEEDNTEVNIIEVPPSTGVIVGEEKEASFFESGSYTLLLGGLFLIALLMFFVLLVVILKK